MEPDQQESVDNTNTETEAPVTPAASTEEPPAYASALEDIPESFRSFVEPAFQKFHQEQDSRYKELEEKLAPWNEFSDYDPDAVKSAVQWAEYLNANPLEAFESLKKSLIENEILKQEEEAQAAAAAAGTVPAIEADDDDDSDDPFAAYAKQFDERFSQLSQVVEGLATTLQQQQKAEEEKRQQQALDELLTNLGEIKEFKDIGGWTPTRQQYVLAQIMRGVPGDRAVKALVEDFHSAAKQLNAPADDAPPVVGGGSPPPSNQITSPAQMSKEQRADYVEKLIEATHRAAQ